MQTLTPKQEAFCQAMLVSDNASEAYRAAYSTKGGSVSANACRLLALPHVATRVQELRDRAADKITEWGGTTTVLPGGTMQFFLAMDPPTVTHQEKQVRVVSGKPVFYEPAALKDARAKLTAHLGQHRPEAPMVGPVRCVVKWLFPATAEHRTGEWRESRPDVDNLTKLLHDCMTATGYWMDDAQVVSSVVEKFWADTPGIYVRIEEMG